MERKDLIPDPGHEIQVLLALLRRAAMACAGFVPLVLAIGCGSGDTKPEAGGASQTTSATAGSGQPAQAPPKEADAGVAKRLLMQRNEFTQALRDAGFEEMKKTTFLDQEAGRRNQILEQISGGGQKLAEFDRNVKNKYPPGVYKEYVQLTNSPGGLHPGTFSLAPNGLHVYLTYDGPYLDPTHLDKKPAPYRWSWKEGQMHRLSKEEDRQRAYTQDVGKDLPGILKRVLEELAQGGPLLPEGAQGMTLAKGERTFGEKARLSADGRQVLFIAGKYSSLDNNYMPLPENNSGLLFHYEVSTRKVRPLSQHLNSEFYEILLSGDGSTAAVVSSTWNFGAEAKDGRSKRRLYLVPTDGSPPLLVPIDLPKVVGNSRRVESTVAREGLSYDGRRVVFSLDGDFCSQICLYDQPAKKLTLVSATPTGHPGTAYSEGAAISADGATVAFASSAKNLSEEPLNDKHIFLYDVATAKLRLITRTAQGQPAVGSSTSPVLNRDGSVLAFLTYSTSLRGAENLPRPLKQFLVVYPVQESRFVALLGTRF